MAKLPVKQPKLPKSLGACVDLYVKTREKRLAEGKTVAEIEAEEKFIKDFIIKSLPKGERGAVGQTHKGVTYNEDIYQVEDWSALYAYIKKEDAFDILNRAINQGAIAERTDKLNEKIDAANAKVSDISKRKPRKLLPGIKTFTTVKLSVTKL